MEKLHAVVLCFLMLAPITFQSVKSETFFIVTTSESPCFESGSSDSIYGSGHPENIDGSLIDEEPQCLTLQQFVERFTNDSYQNLANITLELDSGEHSLNSTLSVFNVTLFTMRSDMAATIICSQPSVRLLLYFIEDVIISGITFVGCKEIEISSVDQFRFENSNFRSSPNGSLILNHTTNATVTGSSFTEVSQRQCHKAAMTISNSSVLVQYCTFSNSEAGIYSTHSAITIDSCTFVNNSLLGCDYIIINGPQTSESVIITNSDFIDNRKVTDDPYVYVTFIYIGGSTLVQNNTFVNNNKFDELLRISTEYNEIIMDHNDVYNNEIYSAMVYIDASNISITISDNNFIDNYATAVFLHISDSTVAINNSYFFGNRGTYWYGNGAVAIGHSPYSRFGCSLNISVMIARCTFIHNYPPRFEHELFEGAVSMCMDTGPVSVLQSTFIDHLSLSRETAAALAIDTNSSVVINSCTFIGNKGYYGGAVYIRSASSVLINHTNFSNNQGSRHYGGALSLFVHKSLIVINESYFYNNINTKLNWTHDSEFYYGDAGTVYLDGEHNSLVIDKSSFVNNEVITIDGGTVYVYGSQTGSVVILHTNFTNNTISGPPYQLRASYGGLLISTDTVKIADSIFFNNSAENCGALSMQVNDIHISNSYFVHNSAVHYSGGAICVFQGLDQMLISNCTFSHNYAKKDGGVLKMKTYDDSAIIDIRGSTFENNRADLQGGVFWTFPLDNGAFYISNSLFIKNQAGSDGGVMVMNIDGYYYSEVNSQLVISESTFNYNRASARGGVFSSFIPYTYVVDNSSFSDNQAGTDGGVMYVGSSNSHIRISDGSTFDFNNATNRGGVISINGSRLEISNTTIFNDNLAVIGDDIIACDCDIITSLEIHSYTDPNFPNCTLYGYQRNRLTTTDYSKPTGYVVAMAVSIPVGFTVILLLLTATVLACLCYRRRYLTKQYGVRRSNHPDFIPLMNNT